MLTVSIPGRETLELNYLVLDYNGTIAVDGALLPGVADTFSAFRVDAPNVILDTLKPADDGSGDLILRLYESGKADTVFTLSTDLPVRSVRRCSPLEDAGEPCEGMVFHVKPFQVMTLRISV